MSAEGKGHAPYVIGHLPGYLDGGRGDPKAPAVLAGRTGQFLHLMGHSFGGRFLCEAVQRAAEPPSVLGWSTPHDPRGPFTADSMLIFQMAAPRDAFTTHFETSSPRTTAPGAPCAARSPLPAPAGTARRATGTCAPSRPPGIGRSGASAAPVELSSTKRSRPTPRTPNSP